MVNRDVTLARSDFTSIRERAHGVVPAAYWGTQPGVHFWLRGGGANFLSASKPLTLSDFGWTTTTQVSTVGTGQNLMAKGTGTPGAFIPTSASSVMLSPAVFGSYDHARDAMEVAGLKSLPRYLIMDTYAAFATDSANETKSGFGFTTSGSSGGTDADKIAYIFTDGTSFRMREGSGPNTSSVTGAKAIDTSWHRFRIILDNQNTTTALWYIDRTAQPTLTTVTAARMPALYESWIDTTNRVSISSVHIFYAWKIPQDVAV